MSHVLAAWQVACSMITCHLIGNFSTNKLRASCSIGISFDRKTILGSGLLSFLKLQDDIFQVRHPVVARYTCMSSLIGI